MHAFAKPHSLCVLAVLVTCAGAMAAEPTLADYRLMYAAKRAELEATYRVAQVAADVSYREALARAAESYQKNGDLDGVIAARHEIERFGAEGTVPQETPQGMPEAIGVLQRAHRNAWQTAQDSQRASNKALVASYQVPLARLKVQLVQQGKLEDAQAVADEMCSVSGVLTNEVPLASAPTPPVQPQASQGGGGWTVSGQGRGDTLQTAACDRAGTLRPTPVVKQLGGAMFGFTLDGKPWPSAAWIVMDGTWSVNCPAGASLTGVGGDGRRYTESFGHGKLEPRSTYRLGGVSFMYFLLDGKPWPSPDWGVESASWSLAVEAAGGTASPK